MALTAAMLSLGLALGPASGGPEDARPAPPRAGTSPSDTVAFDAGRASFRALVRQVEIPYRVFLVSALPGEELLVRVLRPGHRAGAAPDSAPAGAAPSNQAGSVTLL